MPEKKPAKETPVRKRGSKSASVKHNLINTTESDISRIVRESFQYFGRKPPKDDDECAERLQEYFQQCNDEGQLATVEDMALALGVTTSTLWDWQHERRQSPARAEMIKTAKQIIAAMDAKLAAEGKIPQVVYIFRAKNFYGMKDQQEMVLTPNADPLGDRRTGAELAQKYLEAAEGAEEVSENE